MIQKRKMQKHRSGFLTFHWPVNILLDQEYQELKSENDEVAKLVLYMINNPDKFLYRLRLLYDLRLKTIDLISCLRRRSPKIER